jgi:hypothetical protein
MLTLSHAPWRKAVMEDIVDEAAIARARVGMGVFSADGERLGKVWQVHRNHTEVAVEVRPQSFWNTVLGVFSLPAWRTDADHLFVPARVVGGIDEKRVVLQEDASTIRATYAYRPAWIPRKNVAIQPVDWGGL